MPHKNPEKAKAQRKAYYETHKEAKKDYYQANKVKIKAYREAHKEKIKAYGEAYRATHKEEINAYYQTHKEKISAQKKAARERKKQLEKEKNENIAPDLYRNTQLQLDATNALQASETQAASSPTLLRPAAVTTTVGTSLFGFFNLKQSQSAPANDERSVQERMKISNFLN